MSVLTQSGNPRRRTISTTGRSYCDGDNSTHIQREVDAGVQKEEESFWAGRYDEGPEQEARRMKSWRGGV